MNKKVERLAIEAISKGKVLNTDRELSEFFSLVATIAIGALRGSEGDEFIDDFLDAAKADKDFVIKAERMN